MSFQEVNLLSDELVPPKKWLSAQELLLGVGVFAILLIGYSGLQALSLPGLKEIESATRQQLQAMTMVPLRSSSTRELSDQISELQAVKSRQQDVLDALEGPSLRPFSTYLKGLSYARVEGLWLERIELEQAPLETRIGLHGRSLATPKLPELLLALSESEVFGGYQFTDLMVRKQDDVVEFSLFNEEKESS